MESYQFFTLVGLMSAGFGYMIVRLRSIDSRLNSLEARVKDLEYRVVFIDDSVNPLDTYRK